MFALCFAATLGQATASDPFGEGSCDQAITLAPENGPNLILDRHTLVDIDASDDAGHPGFKRIQYVMTEAAAREFTEMTTRNVGRPIEFRIEGKVVSAPVVRMPITGQTGVIYGIDSETADRILAARSADCRRH